MTTVLKVFTNLAIKWDGRQYDKDADVTAVWDPKNMAHRNLLAANMIRFERVVVEDPKPAPPKAPSKK